jgi:hypothetical protein
MSKLIFQQGNYFYTEDTNFIMMKTNFLIRKLSFSWGNQFCIE